ncbi:hypothetical protein MITS9508_01169 [Synechococcus sp. MIT S9508]|nr:hypothetical protein MITS9508_01169 [Synechococcus sp. MIT S9508]
MDQASLLDPFWQGLVSCLACWLLLLLVRLSPLLLLWPLLVSCPVCLGRQSRPLPPKLLYLQALQVPQVFRAWQECRGFRSPDINRSRDCRQPRTLLTSFTNLSELVDSSHQGLLLRFEQALEQFSPAPPAEACCPWMSDRSESP